MISRRSFFRSLLGAAAVVPLAAAGMSSPAEAQSYRPPGPPPPHGGPAPRGPAHSGPPGSPPPARREPRPPARRGYTWVPGHWNWRRGPGWVWQSGHWEENRRGFVYRGPRWVLRRGQWVYEPGRWVRAPR